MEDNLYQIQPIVKTIHGKITPVIIRIEAQTREPNWNLKIEDRLINSQDILTITDNSQIRISPKEVGNITNIEIQNQIGHQTNLDGLKQESLYHSEIHGKYQHQIDLKQ